jgi:hypothetical protein
MRRKRQMPDDQELTDDEFHDALQQEDQMGLVIRTHLFIEYELNKLLELIIPGKKQLKAMGLDYFQRANLLCAIAIDDIYLSPLLSLGKIRNEFAHKPNMKLTKGRERNLYESLSPKDKKIVQKVFKSSNESMPPNKRLNFKKLESPDLFILIAVALRAMLISGRREIEKGDYLSIKVG